MGTSTSPKTRIYSDLSRSPGVGTPNLAVSRLASSNPVTTPGPGVAVVAVRVYTAKRYCRTGFQQVTTIETQRDLYFLFQCYNVWGYCREMREVLLVSRPWLQISRFHGLAKTKRNNMQTLFESTLGHLLKLMEHL